MSSFDPHEDDSPDIAKPGEWNKPHVAHPVKPSAAEILLALIRGADLSNAKVRALGRDLITRVV